MAVRHHNRSFEFNRPRPGKDCALTTIEQWVILQHHNRSDCHIQCCHMTLCQHFARFLQHICQTRLVLLKSLRWQVLSSDVSCAAMDNDSRFDRSDVRRYIDFDSFFEFASVVLYSTPGSPGY